MLSCGGNDKTGNMPIGKCVLACDTMAIEPNIRSSEASHYVPWLLCPLAGGPFNMAEMNKATVHASERTSARDMIQTSFEDDSDLSLKTEKDALKMRKKADKDERAARAALAAHQVCVATVAEHTTCQTRIASAVLCKARRQNVSVSSALASRCSPETGRLWSIQGLPSVMPHGMVETPHGVDFPVCSSRCSPLDLVRQGVVCHDPAVVSYYAGRMCYTVVTLPITYLSTSRLCLSDYTTCHQVNQC